MLGGQSKNQLVPTTNLNMPALARSPSINVVARNRKQEFEADAEGFKFLIESNLISGVSDPVGFSVALAAPDVFFEVVDITDTFSREFGLSGLSGSHPSAQERSKALDVLFDEMASQDTRLRQLIDFRTVFRNSMVALKEEADPIVRAALTRIADEKKSIVQE